MQDPAIAVLPYGMRLGPSLAAVPVDRLSWPLGMPERLNGATVGEMGRDDHLIMFPNTSTHFTLRRGTKARISLILGEPSVIHSKHLALLRVTHRKFHRVLTFNEDLIARIPNGLFFPLGGTWVPEWRDLPLEKTAMCSLIASAKRDSTGHKLRHAIVDWVRDSGADVDVMGHGYKSFDAKADGLAPYRFSVVIENVREQNYFSEKLVDAVLCNTVPIYWGCPNIDHFIDPSALIICTSEDDIRQAINEASEEGFQARLPALQALQPEVAAYGNIEERAAQAIRDDLNAG